MDYEREKYYSSSVSTQLNFTSAQIKVKELHRFSGFGIRTYRDKKLGFSYCQNDLDFQTATENAIKSSTFSPQIDFSFASKKQFSTPTHIFDKKVENMSINELKDILHSIKIHAESKGGKSRIFLSTSVDEKKIENTSGFEGSYSSTSFSAYVEVMDESGFGFEHIVSNSLPKPIDKMGEEAAAMAAKMKNAKKPKSGKYKVVFDPIAFENILDTLLPSFSGDYLRRKVTKLKKDKKMFSDKLTIYEDPSANAINSHPFDDEGVVLNKSIPLIEKGVVKNFCFDNETIALSNQNKKNQLDGGFCIRSSFQSAPSIGHSNIVIRPGDYSDFESELEEHLVICSAHGSHTANITTGELGLEVSNAYLVNKKGEKNPMRNFMISTNVFDLLDNIFGLEKSQRTYLNVVSPRFAFNNVQVI